MKENGYFTKTPELQFETLNEQLNNKNVKTSLSHRQKKILFRKKLTKIGFAILLISLIICIIYIITNQILLPWIRTPTLQLTSSLLKHINYNNTLSRILTYKGKNLHLLYKASYHGDYYKDLLYNVKGKNSLFILVQMNDNRIFGANINQELIKGNNTLNINSNVFSVVSGDSFYILHKYIIIDDGHLLTVGTCFEIKEGCISSKVPSFVNLPITVDEEDEINRKPKKIEVKEFEIFEVLTS